MNGKIISIALALVSATASAPRAQEVLFTIAGSGGDPDASFELPQSPSPDVIDPGVYFGFFSVPATIDGVPSNLFGLDFYNAPAGGGLLDDSYYSLYGVQFYSGTENGPTFAPGVYDGMYNGVTGNSDTVTISVVPELSTWMMIAVGFSGLALVRAFAKGAGHRLHGSATLRNS
jgi:hypothetical protein